MKETNKILNLLELKILSECTKGMRLNEIAKEIGLTNSEIYTISSGIKKKLNAKNMTNAVYIAYK